jgi:ketosteroid isomerase-like protein
MDSGGCSDENADAGKVRQVLPWEAKLNYWSLARSLRARLAVAIAACLALLVGGVVAVSSGASASTRPGHPFHLTAQDASRWMKGYLNAWETRDADAVVKLFTPNGVYQSLPGDPTQTFVGRAAIHKYWFDVTRPQSQITGIQGRPIVDGNRAAVEIWVKFVDPVYNPDGDHKITLLETNVLTFASGRLVSKNVEYWNILTGWHSPPPGWGR